MKAKREITYSETRHLNRFTVTAIAIAAAVGAVLIKATLIGEFEWFGVG